MKVHIKKLYPDSVIPSFGHNDHSNAGLDLCAYIGNDLDSYVVMRPGDSLVLGTGVAWEPGKPEFEGWKPAMIIKGRSGFAINHGIEVTNAGVIDSGYRGEIKVRLEHRGREPVVIRNGDRIAQGVVVLIPEIDVAEAQELSSTPRGERGFGSSGV